MDFEYIRSTYFPRWDRKQEWKLQQDHPDCASSLWGNCMLDKKIIVIRDTARHNLIHEISHAVTFTGHGKRWQKRMEKAAIRAEEIGDIELAVQIREDYTAYSDPNRCFTPTAESVRNELVDAVLGMRGKIPFERAIEFVANENGMTSEQRLKKYSAKK